MRNAAPGGSRSRRISSPSKSRWRSSCWPQPPADPGRTDCSTRIAGFRQTTSPSCRSAGPFRRTPNRFRASSISTISTTSPRCRASKRPPLPPAAAAQPARRELLNRGRPADLASIERQPATFQIVSSDYFRASDSVARGTVHLEQRLAGPAARGGRQRHHGAALLAG